MAPACSRSSAISLPQSATAVAAVLTNFRDQLKKSKEEGSIIEISDEILQPVNEIFKGRQVQDTNFQARLVSDIISNLDGKNDICGRLNIPIYNTLLHLFCHTTDCNKVERGLYLLTAAVYHEAHSPGLERRQREIEARKTAIGKDCLHLLLVFFTNAEHTMKLRRWVGILLLELLEGSDKNLESFQLGSEEARRKLGSILLTESNEILKNICGQLIRVLVDADVPREDIWPVGTDNEIYEGFPDSSQLGHWNQRFQEYLDKVDESDVLDACYFPQDLETKPSYSLGRKGHTTNVFTNFETMSIWSPASATEIDRFLEIPLQRITTMTISTNRESQLPNGVARVHFDLQDNADDPYFLNASEVSLSQVAMILSTPAAKDMTIDLSKCCLEIEICETEDASQDPSLDGNKEQESLLSARSSTADELMIFHLGQPGTIEPRVSQIQKAISSQAKQAHKPANTHSSRGQESSEGQSELRESVESQTRNHNDTQKQLKNTRSQPKKVGKNSGEAALKLKPKKPLQIHQKVDSTTGKAPTVAENSTGLEVNKVVSKAKTVKDVLHRTESSDKTLAQKVEKLSQTFPNENLAVLRGVLVVSDGNIELATEQLHNRQTNISSDEASKVRGEGSSRLNKADEHFDSTSFTSPEWNDALTPKFSKSSHNKKVVIAPCRKSEATESQRATKDASPENGNQSSKPRPKYTLKSKEPLVVAKSAKQPSKIQEKLKGNILNSAAEKPKAVGKSKSQMTRNSKSKTAEGETTVRNGRVTQKPNIFEEDIYDLDANNSNDEDVTETSNRGKRSVTKANAKAQAKKAVIATKKSTKSAKADPKKRQSAPAVLETTAAASRSRRSAAIVASQKFLQADCRDHNTEDEQDFAEAKKTHNPQKEKAATNQALTKSIPEVKQPDAKDVCVLFLEGQDLVNLQQGSAIGLGLLDKSNMDKTPASGMELYDASPKQPIKKQTKRTTTKQAESLNNGLKKVSRSGGNFSTKLGDMLCKLDEIWDPLQSQVQRNSSKGKIPSGRLQRGDPAKQSDMWKEKNSFDSRGKIVLDGLADNEEGQHGSSRGDLAIVNNKDINDTAGHPTQADDKTISSGRQDSSADEGLLNNDAPVDNKDKRGQGAKRDSGVDQASANYDASTSVPGLDAKEALSDNSGKRKAFDQIEASPKRRRFQGDGVPANKGPSVRQSNGLETDVEEASKILNNILSDKPLADDHLNRKVQLVNFSIRGAMNQGPSSGQRSSIGKNGIGQQARPASSPVTHKAKRTRNGLNESNTGVQDVGRPKKRQSVSSSNNHEDFRMNDDDHVKYLSSPPPPHPQNRRPSRPSSQASRVDPNGSPRALISAEKVDHFSRVAQKLLQDDQQQQQGGDIERSLNRNGAFGPRVRLASIPKIGPSSPQKVEVRYVKHQKMSNGIYEGIETKEIIAQEKSMADPFLGGPARQSSGFTHKLQAGASKENRMLDTAHQPKKCNPAPIQVLKLTVENSAELPAYTVQKMAKEQSGRLPQKTEVEVYGEETTLVNSGADLHSSPTDTTNGSSIGNSRSPLSERVNDAWNLALRPHYANLSTVAHRLADEVIIRLAKEEDIMGLLVNRYKENGGKLLAHMTDQRGEEKAKIAANLEQQKKTMVEVYAEAKVFVSDSEKSLKSSSLLKFEKKWQQEQEGIQRRIDEGRKAIQ